MSIFKDISDFYNIPIFHKGALLKKLRVEWLKPKEKWRDYSKIKHLLELTTTTDQKGLIDNKTWYDLGMNAVFESVDVTISEVGQQTLYKNMHLLRESKEELQKRYEFSNRLREDKKLRESIQVCLYPLSLIPTRPSIDFLFKKFDLIKVPKSLITFWFILSAAVFFVVCYLNWKRSILLRF